MADTGWNTPSPRDVTERMQADLEAEIGADARLPPWQGAMTAVAGAFWSLYAFTAHVAGNLLPDRQRGPILRRMAFGVFGLDEQPGARSSGVIRFEGTDGTDVAEGVRARRDDGVEYETTAAGTIAGGFVELAAEAVEIGSAGNADPDTELELVSPIAGVLESGVSVVSMEDGSDAENEDALSARYVAAFRRPLLGGAPGDFERWAIESLGVGSDGLAVVHRVWVFRATPAPGKITVRFAVRWDGADPLSAVPSVGQVAAVAAYLEARMPHSVDELVVEAVVARTVDVTLALYDDTTAKRDAVTAELNALFQRAGGPDTTVRNSTLRQAVGRGAEEYELTDVDGDATGTSHVGLTALELAVLGTITWA